MYYSLPKEGDLFGLLESSMSDFENNLLDKIMKKMKKFQDNYQGDVAYISLTEGILFPKDLKEVITPLRMNINEFLYRNFTYHDIFGEIDAQPYNLKDYYGQKAIEKIFINSTVKIETLFTNLYSNIEKDLFELGFTDCKLRSQGITVYFHKNEDVELFIAHIEGILSSSYNSAISKALRNKELFNISLTSFLDDENYLVFKISSFEKVEYELATKGIFTKMDNISLNDNIISFILDQDEIISKNKDLFLFKKKSEDSIVFIPKNVNAKCLYDFGYFNEQDFRRLIDLSRKSYDTWKGRSFDYDFLVKNFKFI